MHCLLVRHFKRRLGRAKSVHARSVSSWPAAARPLMQPWHMYRTQTLDRQVAVMERPFAFHIGTAARTIHVVGTLCQAIGFVLRKDRW